MLSVLLLGGTACTGSDLEDSARPTTTMAATGAETLPAEGSRTRERRRADSDPVPEVSVPELPGPDELLTSTPDELSLAIDEAVESPDLDILDVAGIADHGPTPEETAGFGDGNRRTGSGRLVALDESASLACANVELALYALDSGDEGEAEVQVARAADRARGSDLGPVRSWADPLAGAAGGTDGSIDAVVLVGFLSLCVEGGHEL